MSPLFCIDPKCCLLLAWKPYDFSVHMINNIRQRELFKRNINTGSKILLPGFVLTGPLTVPKNLNSNSVLKDMFT